jgi:hypothetical protein
MIDRHVAAHIAETGSQPAPGVDASRALGEVLSRAAAGSAVATFTPETASAPWPPDQAAHWLVESLARPWPPLVGPVFVVEVLRRDTASSAIVATGMEVFGDTPWPQAQRGVFAFRHDWSEALVERLEWQTSVTRLASGNESRQARRKVPRRSLSYHVGHARPTDALVADWLADHLGTASWWPLPQYAVPLTASAEAGVFALEVADADWRQFVTASADLRLTWNGIEGWNEADVFALLIAPDGWQQVRISSVDSDVLWLAEPLARAAGVGSSVMPLVWGRSNRCRHPIPVCWMTHGWTICRSGPMATGVTIRRLARKRRSPGRIFRLPIRGCAVTIRGRPPPTSAAIWPARPRRSRSGASGCGKPKAA